ncbi:hypothetical protein FJTKL_01713 [Diaporthe vaccinii]|uniref:Chromo domain-containing protein n=1 Tax=Diaporthe vaccinii TaxID=105482 RepID=A0ABR4DZR7_9PEZI
MANISLDNQLFFAPSPLSSGKPISQSPCPRNKGVPIASPGGQEKPRQDGHNSQRGSLAGPMANVIEISSDNESDYSDFGESRSHTSIPRVDELCPPVTPETQADSVFDPSMSFNSSCGGSGLREPAVTDTTSSEPEPLPIAAARPDFAVERVQDGSQKPPFAGPSHAITSSQSQQPGAVDAAASALPSSPWIPSSPTSSEAGSTHGVDDLFGDCRAQATGAAHGANRRDTATQFNKELIGLYWSDSDRDSLSPAPPTEKFRPRGSPSYIDSASRAKKWDEKFPFSPQAPRSRAGHRSQLGQQRARVPEGLPATPAIAEPWRLPGLVRAVQQDKPDSQESTSEAEQTSSLRETARSEAAMKIAHATPPHVGSSPLSSPKHSSLPRPRPKIGTHRESRPVLVSVSRGDRDDQASSPPCKRNGTPGSPAARYGIRDSVGSFDIHGDNADGDGVQQALADKSKLPQRRKRRRVDSQRERRLYQQDTEDIHSSAEDSSNDWVARPPRRRRVNPPDPSHTTAAGRQTSSASENPGLQQVQTQNSESVEALAAKFAEWLSETADVRKAKVDGATIFQLRFKQDLRCSTCRPVVLGNRRSGYTSHVPARQRNSTLGRILSGESPLAENPLHSPTENDVQASPFTESGAEYEIEEIVECRRRGRGWQVRVKWAHCERLTWEPRKNFLGTDSLIAFEAQHRPL